MHLQVPQGFALACTAGMGFGLYGVVFIPQLGASMLRIHCPQESKDGDDGAVVLAVVVQVSCASWARQATAACTQSLRSRAS
jgi:hypothetical protein